jgi:hypothetical protein
MLRLAALLRYPVQRGAVLGGQHHLARLQAHALTAFQAFKDAFGLLAPIGNDLRELFEQGLGHFSFRIKPIVEDILQHKV